MATTNPAKKRKVRKGDEDREWDLHSFLSPNGAGVAVTAAPMLLTQYNACVKSGCVMTLSTNGSQDESSYAAKNIIAAWKATVTSAPRKELHRAVTTLLQNQFDSLSKIVATVKCYEKAKMTSQFIQGEDEIEWLVGPNSAVLRRHALLRRLAMPMHVHVNEKGISNLATMAFSFLDLLLQMDDVKNQAVESIISRAASIGDTMSLPVCSDHARTLLQDLQGLLISTLRQLGGEISIGDIKVDLALLEPTMLKQFVTLKTNPSKQQREACSLPESMRDEVLAVREERKRLLQEFEVRKKSGYSEQSCSCRRGKSKMPKRMWNGCLLLTEDDISHQEFCDEVKIMVALNKTLRRPYNPGVSRPKLQKLEISNQSLNELKAIFFDKDGSLKRDIIEDIDLSTRHGYINFSNASCQDPRNDQRWQIPLKRHTMRVVSTRSAFETFLSQKGLMDPSREKIHDLGMLIGGTEDQSIHHDIPRQTTAWLPAVPDSNSGDRPSVPVPGWEFDRIAYNEAMASLYAPGSVLFGMGETGEMQIGVQKNQIERYGCADGWCRIVDGKADEEFRIVRENDFLVVLLANPGVMFSGDFPHAGVRNFPKGSRGDKLMKKLNNSIQAILDEGEEGGEEHSDTRKEIMNLMCSFKDLDKICRLHCSTEPLVDWLRIPRNTVGFVGCRPNPPEGGGEPNEREENADPVAEMEADNEHHHEEVDKQSVSASEEDDDWSGSF